ncbi:ras-induced vulval development antagonist-domain-containing protein [Mycena floridula]|nr:ras-induced vulval development antagonist-domain-containing protein [Mycena floridula]
MATVHPSRMALVPQDPISKSNRGRSPSPRSGSQDKFRDRRDRGRENTDAKDNRERRASPQYEDYRKAAPVPQENMYQRNRPAEFRSGGGDFMESRRLQRESMTVNVWPQSPKAPARSLSPKRKSKRSKRARSPSSSDSSSDEERRRKERKERKRREKEKDKESRREKRRRSTSRRRSYDDDEDDSRRRSRPRSKRSVTPRARSHVSAEPEDEWTVKPTAGILISPPQRLKDTRPLDDEGSASESADDDDLGPQPLVKPNHSKRIDDRSFGGSLLRGEGSAMAAFLQDGTDSRIPRRGEIGLTSDEIARYEGVGYVMSGSRHRRMNAVRMRKENQVISAEEKRGILKLQKEERERREAILREEFTELVQDHLGKT